MADCARQHERKEINLSCKKSREFSQWSNYCNEMVSYCRSIGLPFEYLGYQ